MCGYFGVRDVGVFELDHGQPFSASFPFFLEPFLFWKFCGFPYMYVEKLDFNNLKAGSVLIFFVSILVDHSSSTIKHLFE